MQYQECAAQKNQSNECIRFAVPRGVAGMRRCMCKLYASLMFVALIPLCDRVGVLHDFAGPFAYLHIATA